MKFVKVTPIGGATRILNTQYIKGVFMDVDDVRISIIHTTDGNKIEVDLPLIKIFDALGTASDSVNLDVIKL